MNSMFSKLIELVLIGVERQEGLSFRSRNEKVDNGQILFSLCPHDTIVGKYGRLCEIYIKCDLETSTAEVKYMWWAGRWTSSSTKIPFNRISANHLDIARCYRVELAAMRITHTILMDLTSEKDSL